MNRFVSSLRYAWSGISTAVSEQRNLKIHAGVAMVVVVAGIYFRISEVEWLVIVLAIGLVFTAELVNTAIEHLVNLISPQRQPLAGKIKDIAAGAVLTAVIAAVIAGYLVFRKHLWP